MTSEDLSLSDPSSDESLSLSSASDEDFPQDEWAVRRILAEAKVQGEIKYLIDWDGFDLCDATWEPAAHLSEGLLADWLTTKKKTGKKTVPGFKIDQWRQAVNDDIRAKYAKHTKRNQQRARLGLGQSELDFTLEQWINSVQGPSEDESTDTNEEHIQEKYSAHVSEPPTTEPRIVGQSSAGIYDQSKEQKARSSLRESQGTQDNRTLSIKEGPVLQFECQTSHCPLESPQDSPENEKKSPVQAAQAGLCALDSQKSTLSSTPKSKGAPHQPESPPKTAFRFRIPSVDSALMPNVFVGGKKRKARRNLLDAASDPSRPPKFLNHHKQRLIEKGLRDKEGVTPPRKEGNEPLRVHPIQAAMQPINTMPASGQIRGILVPRSSLDRVIPIPSPKKKRVHWEDDLISQKPQIPAELESLFVSDEPSIVALNADFCAMGASAESPSKRSPSISSAQLLPSCDRSTISKPCQFGSPDGLLATLEFRDLQLKNKPSWSCCFDGSDRLVFCHVCTVHDLLSQTACGALEELSICQGTTSCSGMDKNIVMLVANRLQSGYFAAHGPARLAVCSDICDWLFDLSQSKGATRGVSEPCHPGIRATERAVEALTKCCNLMRYIIGETENFEEGPLVYAPDVLDGNDEQSLVNWFGSWAMLHIQQIRKFLVLGSSYQTEARLSRVIRPVQFVTCCTEHLPPQDLVTVQTPHGLQPGAASVIPEAMLAAKTGEFLTGIERGYGGLSFSPLVLYRYPITCWDPETILQLGDCKSCFKDYSNWFNHFKEPFFLRPMGLSSINMLPNYKNTYLGLFYTRDEKQKSVCSSSREAQVQNLRPWIAIYRPADIHTRPWKNMELLIWDPLIRNSVFQGNGFYEGELLSAQERLVSYIVDSSQDLKTTLPLERVWVGPFDDHQDDGFVDPFDCVLSWIRTISNSVKERLPLYGKQLSSRGWKQVDLEDLLTRAAEGNVPRQISETQSANKQCLPLRTVFQAPKPNIGARRSSICNNRLQAAMLRHQDSNEIYFTFQPTLKWYGEQVAAGRGLQHIKVLDWQTFFTRHKIHDPED
ncbi:chromo domain-containing protein [Metarhizium guizhouense ARSEF 977]|uniref:Chromo domain-containing protein n=1 Tax=Metarhizium guizhouense (strain ARSEF 977) TaxID=1276136 RepID=A0A0B4IA05_METGA|nr:chromo domain-containing protein [Metarhizium guizhouense ARSEF 977]